VVGNDNGTKQDKSGQFSSNQDSFIKLTSWQSIYNSTDKNKHAGLL